MTSFESILIGGSLLANGEDSSMYSSVDAIRLGGGGSGRSVLLSALYVTVTGLIQCNGGNANKSIRTGGGGEGGRIAILGDQKLLTDALLQVMGGRGFVALQA